MRADVAAPSRPGAPFGPTPIVTPLFASEVSALFTTSFGVFVRRFIPTCGFGAFGRSATCPGPSPSLRSTSPRVGGEVCSAPRFPAAGASFPVASAASAVPRRTLPA